jgi:hypothetical protein
MGSYSLKFGSPMQISLFVEASFYLHDAGDLLSLFSGPNQRFNKGRIVTDTICGHLDRDGLGIVSGSVYERFDAGVKALVWMMHKHVTGLNGREDSRVLEGRGYERRPRGFTQLWERQAHELKQAPVVQSSCIS